MQNSDLNLLDEANDNKQAGASADSHQSYSLLAPALLVSCALWFVVGLAIWRAFRP
jgi:hypothetical protein